jgi:hypothetical protein
VSSEIIESAKVSPTVDPPARCKHFVLHGAIPFAAVELGASREAENAKQEGELAARGPTVS